MKKLSVCFLVAIGIFFVCAAFFQDYDLAKSIEHGKNVYTANCNDCHMSNGIDPQDQYPPLAKADYLMHPVDSLIIIVLKGQTGEIIVNGKKYDDQMLAQDYLSDAEIADVLNYVRNSWGNKMPVITPQQVKALRQ
jgi:mono/diheme cytochrome c family protein